MQFKNIGFDSNNVISFENGGNYFHNPFEVALQALIGKNVLDVYENPDGNLIPRYYSLEDLPDISGDEYAEAALVWLKNNYIMVGEAFLWNYDYDGEYEENHLRAPWHSSFGQAYVILALVQYYRYGRNEYSTMLEGAVKGLLLPTEKGGCLLNNKEYFWFEEIVGEKMTHIFNAHLISLIALLNVKRYVHYDWLDNIIEKGMNSFYAHMHQMDSGINSIYDIRSKHDCMLQLLPDDEGIGIAIKSIQIDDRELLLSGQECFEIKEQWIAGIEWGDVDTEGYRRLIHGKTVHSTKPMGGERQNTYLYFKNVERKKDYIVLKIRYKVEEDTFLILNRNCGENGYQKLGYINKLFLPKDKNEITAHIPFVAIAPHVSRVYHRFHIQLLEELSILQDGFRGKYLISKFREYGEESRKNLIDVNNDKEENILSGVSVSVNDQCGLFCKMCDLGIKNRESSMYYYMKNKEEHKNLDVDVLIKRCKEAKDTLRVVQFVGTEPTLYTELPKAVNALRDMGLKVLVTTNGINLKNMLDKLLEANLSELDISIDGPAEVHDKIRGKKGLFHDIMAVLEEHREKIEVAQNKGFRLGIGVAITPMNYMKLPELLCELKGSVIQSVWCTHMNFITEKIAAAHTQEYPQFPIGASCTHHEMNPNAVNPWLMYKKIREAKKKAKEIGINFVCVPAMEDYLDYRYFYHYPNVTVGRTRCSAPKRTLQINSDGSVCIMSRCYQFDLGNIYDDSLEEIFYSQKMEEFREYVGKKLYDPCKRCCAIM